MGRERYACQVGWRCFRLGVLLGVIVRTETSLITFKDSSYSLCFPSLSPDNIQGQQLSQPRLSQPSHFSLHCFNYCMPRLLKTALVSAQRGRTCPDSPLRTVWIPPCILCFQGSKAQLLPASLSVQLFPTLCSPMSYCSCYPVAFLSLRWVEF